MKTKSLFISAQEINAGMLFVSMGMMEILKRNLHRVAFFRPIIASKERRDEDIDFILQRYNLDMKYEDAYGYDIEYVENMIASNRFHELINGLIEKFKKLESNYDFVLCEGIRRSFLNANINYDLNIKIAQNFGSPYINIINAKERTTQELYEDIMIENENLLSQGCSHFATFINRLDTKKYEEIQVKLQDFEEKIYLLKEVEELSLLSIQDLMDGLKAKEVLLTKEDRTRSIRKVRVAALTLDNFLDHIEEDDLVIVPADRSDIILGLLGALYSKSYANISAIIFPFNMRAHPNINKLIFGLEQFTIPILAVDTDTYETARNISKIHSRIRLGSDRKIALSLGLFNATVDTAYIENKIASSTSNIMTPMMFEYKLFEMARRNKKRIVLPESSDERILRAAEIIMLRDVAEIILIGNKEKIKENSLRLGLDLSKATIIEHTDSALMREFISVFYEMRKNKGLTYHGAEDAMSKVNYFGTMMVQLGYADGMVSGAIHSTGDTVLPALQIIKTTPDVSIVSSVFFMCLETKVLVYGDCAVNQDPNAESLAQIAISSAKTAAAFGIDPKIAMLSYSTGDSGSGADVEKVREATKIVKGRNPDLLIEGPIQYDAAVNKSVASTKLPNSKVAGLATVFIFPDLNTGNNTYKAVQRSSNAVAVGPILQGLNKPVNDLSRGCLVEDIVNTVAITAVQAGQN
ncbi:MAG: phosphate acetyltransferase [Sulfurimonas sp.]|nr:phosphate acetyltransferase [Sulfurimonas sp.]MBU1216866.1 phosphate acetyltransferase [bacterium]MBU1434993.1 phosphate acetyltransferase [bacterium]MBU1504098.1 phosphate acetyltransferase [bacterium]MBU3938551.1 phosphate acetyltransferase [bacterium]